MGKKKSRLTVGTRNFIAVLFALCSIVLFIPLAAIAAYLIFEIFGQESIILNLFEKLNLGSAFQSFINKFNAPDIYKFNQGYLFFCVISIIVLILFSFKKDTTGWVLSLLYIVAALVFLYYFALCVLFPTHVPMQIFFDLPYKISLKETIITLFSDIQFLTCCTTIIPFAISIIDSNVNKANTNAEWAQGYEHYTEQLKNIDNTKDRQLPKTLRLLPTYWGLLFIFLFQFLISIFFANDSVMSFYLRTLLSLIAPFANNSIFKMTALEKKVAYNEQLAKTYKDIAAISLDAATIANENTEYYKDAYQRESIERENESNSADFWFEEAQFWHSQSHDDSCFESHYKRANDDFEE